MIRRLLSNEKKYFIRLVLLITLSAVVVSCASIASPGGGDYDFDPPRVLRSTPKEKELNVNIRKIEIVFDELVQIEKPMEKVIVTPPQTNIPIIRAQNNKVIVELKDSLQANTTYTIDFTDAIADNNEKNALENFALSFSTGSVIDSMAISGKVLAANNLEPMAGIYVGIHSNLSDTAFTKIPFLRISRTNEVGNFSVKGVAPGSYKIFALNDINRDYMYDNPNEAMAFLDTIIIPSSVPAVRYDSIFNVKTFAFDSLKAIDYTRFLPDDVILRASTSPFKRQYLQKHERLTSDVLTIYFGGATAMPKVEALDISFDIAEWSVLEKTINNDTLKYWITKPTILSMDTIALKVSYNKTDSLNQLQLVTDTLNFVNRHKDKTPTKEVKKKKGEKEEEPFLSVNTSIRSEFDVYKDIDIEFAYPVADFEKNKLRLVLAKDSLEKPLDYQLLIDSLNPRKYIMKHPWKHEVEYKLAIDSGAIHAYNGWANKEDITIFKIKALDKYGSLALNIAGLSDEMPAFVELLDKSDKALYKADVKQGLATFLYLDPAVYYARITLDANGNGRWDTGEYSEKRQPEEVYYCDKYFEIKAYWDIEEDWDLMMLPLDKQKPLEITKNKPKDEAKRKKEMQRRDAKQEKTNSQQNNNGRDRTNSMNNNRSTNTDNNMY
ncbi:MAG: hypothetical protein RL662_91 [Bacteroidota bacterium]|jgi:hypothetical protein